MSARRNGWNSCCWWGGLQPRAITANSSPPNGCVALLRPLQLVLPDPIGLRGIFKRRPVARITSHQALEAVDTWFGQRSPAMGAALLSA